MSTRKYAIQYDYYILFAYILLMLIGLYTQLNISSVRSSMTFFYKQVMWFFISLFAVWFAFKKVNFEILPIETTSIQDEKPLSLNYNVNFRPLT